MIMLVSQGPGYRALTAARMGCSFADVAQVRPQYRSTDGVTGAAHIGP